MKFIKQFQSGVRSLTSQRFQDLLIKEGYPFYPVVSTIWKESEKRLLVIMESVDKSDIRNGKFLNLARSDRDVLMNPISHLMPHLLDRAIQIRNDWSGSVQDNEFAFAAVNFNAYKTHDLSPGLQDAKYREFAARVTKVIGYLKPTHILCCGFTATSYLLDSISHPEKEHSYVKNGWVFPAKFGEVDTLFCPTIDLDTICSPPSSSEEESEEDSYAVTDLLYFVCRNAANLLLGYNPHSLRKVLVSYKLVDTISKFDKLMARLRDSEEPIAIDSETQSLETIHNKIYFMQFCCDGKTGYVLPIDHPHESNPFSAEERDYIRTTLGEFYAEDRKAHLKTLVFQNGMFDMRVFRYQLKVKFIHHTVHELTAAEQLLDENIGHLTKIKLRDGTSYVSCSYQNLKNMLCLYENDFYYDESRKVNKSNRGKIGSLPVDDPDSLLYSAADVVFPWHMSKMQLLRAEHTRIRLGPNEARISYGEMYKTHLHNIMKAVCVSISHMEENGSPVDLAYLKHLMSKGSPIITKITEIDHDFKEFPNVKKAESVIMAKLGRSTGSLFAGYSTNMFSLAKKAHLESLFFEVLNLDAVSFTDTGARAIDKVFIKQYSADHPEVKMFGEYVQATKLYSTYIKGWYKKLMSSLDTAKNHFLRPGFGFFTIVTGRLNSFNPSLQQVPSRGKMAPIIHRMFAAPPGCLNFSGDLNAAECRGASVLAGDEAYAAAFKVGQKMRRQYMLTPTEEVKKSLKTDGDIHLVSVKLFFGKVVEKSHPLRSAVKAVVFGVLYGKSARSLGVSLKEDEISGLMDERRKLVAELKSLKEKSDGPRS
jgi:DNA polymerase I-like protein with 3'-5' exonuclease and polymerase domains